MNVATIEDKLIETIKALDLFSTLQSAGRQDLPPVYSYPACFVFFDGDKDTGSIPRPVDEVTFAVTIQLQNLSQEMVAARDIYTINDLVRNAIRGKLLGLDAVEPFTCISRQCTGYDDSEGVIEYTHTYRTRLYSPVPVE
jgi:hypothetical protein